MPHQSNALPSPVSFPPPPGGVGSMHDVRRIEATQPDPLAGVSSTYDLLCQGAAKGPENKAMSFFLRTEDFRQPFQWTHAQWLARITQAANMFHRLGIGRGDVIAFVLPNLPETHWTIWGGEAAGIVMAVNPLLEPALIAELMNAAKPRIVVTLAPTPGVDIWQKVAKAVRDVPSVKHVLTVTPLTYLRSPIAPLLRAVVRLKTPRRIRAATVMPFHRALKKAPDDALRFPPPRLTDIASYFCTGGTTGLPKIAMRSHRTEVANALQLNAVFGQAVDPAEAALFCGLPLFHVNAQIGTGLAAWAGGAHIVLGTPMGYRGPGLVPKFWDIASFYRISSFSGVPTLYSALLQYPPKGQDLSELKYGLCGAAPMPMELFHRFQKETGIKIIEGYGLTEGGCVSSLNPPDGQTQLGSIGIRMPWQDMKIVILDDEGQWARDAANDEPGTVVIRGPNLFEGYLDATHNKGLWVQRPNPNGQRETWLNTGDLGRQDAKGYFWLTGRKKELIIRGGHNIDPKLIEEAMCQHPSVAMAAAVGRPDTHAGEVPVVYAQLRPGTMATEAELLAFAQQKVSERAAWPKQVMILPALPTTPIGKIHKPALNLRELEAVVRREASAVGVELAACRAEQDSRHGMVVRWAAKGDATALRKALSSYTFKALETQG